MIQLIFIINWTKVTYLYFFFATLFYIDLV